MENNTKEHKYLDNVLIKLKRAYSRDETVAALTKKLSKTELKLGKALSYIDELEYDKNQKSFQNGGEQWFKKYRKMEARFVEMREKKIEEGEQLVRFARFISNNSKLARWMTSDELLEEFKKSQRKTI